MFRPQRLWIQWGMDRRYMERQLAMFKCSIFGPPVVAREQVKEELSFTFPSYPKLEVAGGDAAEKKIKIQRHLSAETSGFQ